MVVELRCAKFKTTPIVDCPNERLNAGKSVLTTKNIVDLYLRDP